MLAETRALLNNRLLVHHDKSSRSSNFSAEKKIQIVGLFKRERRLLRLPICKEALNPKNRYFTAGRLLLVLRN
jgi:hypothetical protein